MRSRLWTIANTLMLLAFIFSVVVQFNDPDPWRWAAIYSAAAIVTGLEMARRSGIVAPIIVAAVAAVWAWTIAPRVLGKVRFSDLFAEFEMANVGIEESREFYGLCFIALWMAAVAVAAWRRRAGSAQRL